MDVVNSLRRPDEASFAGGAFVVVRCEDRKSWEVLRAKGHVVNRAGVDGLLVPARAAVGANPIPFCLMAGNRLLRDIPPGTVIAADMVAPPKESLLWTLRQQLEVTFALS